MQGKYTSGSIFKCNEKGWMTELMVEWLREFCDRRPGVLKETRNAGVSCFQGSQHESEKSDL
jgi:hypothetical protein